MTTTASAHVKGGRLCILGLHECALGPIPFAYSVEVAGMSDGPVDFGADDLPDVLSQAIDKSKKPMLGIIEREKMRVAAESLVERARAGDQNAMAMISAVREQASKGSKRARKSVKLLQQYIDANPVSESSDDHYSPKRILPPVVKQLGAHVGNDAAVSAWTPGVGDLYLAGVVLANGPNLTKDRVVGIGSHFGEDEEAYWTGFKQWKDPVDNFGADEGSDAAFTGRAVGLARTIQGVREGALPVSRLCPMAGWELGE